MARCSRGARGTTLKDVTTVRPAAIAEYRMVTATLAGEPGKTRLALSVTAEAGRERRDGVWFAGLLHETDPAMVTAAAAQAAGVPGQRDRLAVAHVTSRLATQRASCGAPAASNGQEAVFRGRGCRIARPT
jgi:predicted ATPase